MARRADEEAGIQRRMRRVWHGSVAPSFASNWRIGASKRSPVTFSIDKDWRPCRRVPNILYLPAQKFGTTGQESRTWAMNTYLAGMVCERFPKSRIVAYSTGNVYPLTAVDSGGPTEDTTPRSRRRIRHDGHGARADVRVLQREVRNSRFDRASELRRRDAIRRTGRHRPRRCRQSSRSI